jgi:exodeoxyribonuclease VII small subunit
MSYDEAIKRAETIIAHLEQTEAISVEEYKKLAKEATRLLDECKSELQQMSSQLTAQ